MNKEHDSGYRYLFSNPALVKDLIMGFVPDDWLHSLDYSTLESVNASYVSEDMKQRHSDVIWRVKAGGQWVYLYLLIEFQSSVDVYMALRMMVYQGLLYQDLIKAKAVLEDGRLPPILPIVLYNGKERWTAAADVSDLIPAVPGLVAQFKPQVKHLLIDENAYSDHELASLKNLVAAVFRIEHPTSPQAMLELLKNLEAWLADSPDLRRMFGCWIRATLMRNSEYKVLLPQVDDLQELNVMLADKLEEWALEYKAEGKSEGKVEGEILALQKLLSRRFGAIPAELTAKIANASLEEIERWFDLAIDATRLADIFER